MSNPFSLATFAGLSMNLLLQMGLGLRDFTLEPDRSWIYGVYQTLILTGSVMLLWLLFSYVFTPLSLGFLEYLLPFPLLALLFRGLDWVSKQQSALSEELPQDSYQGWILAALFITLRLAQSPGDALAISLSFSLGNLLSVALIKNIHKRISLERLPYFLRGIPLLLISMGFLALIFLVISTTLFH